MTSHTATQEATPAHTIDRWLWLALLIAFLGALWIQGPRLLDPYTVEEDARSFYWWHSFQDPELFRDTVHYQRSISELQFGPLILIVSERSPGYSLLFQIANTVVPPLLFSKLLIFPLLLVAVYYLFQIGALFKGSGAAFALCMAYVVLNLASPTSISAVGGLQRSFMLPFLLALIYYLMRDSFKAAAIVIFLTGIIYAPTAVLGAVLYGLYIIDPEAKSWRSLINWRHLTPLVLATLLAVLFLLPTFLDQLGRGATGGNSLVDEQPGRESLLTDPRFQAGGRRELFTVFPLVGRGGIATSTGNFLHIFFLAALAIGTFSLRPASLAELPRVLKLLFVASVLCFTVSWLLALLTAAFPLYLPSRYTRASLPLFLLIYVTLNGRDSMQHAAGWLHQIRERAFLVTIPLALVTLTIAIFGPGPEEHVSSAILFRHSRTVLIALSVLLLTLSVLAFRGKTNQTDVATAAPVQKGLSQRAWIFLGVSILIPMLFYVQVFHARFYVASPAERELYQYLETLPQDIVIGGSPCLLDGVPLFAKRQILFSCEDPHPDQELMLQALQAYYAEDPRQIDGFCREQGLDYLVVNESEFAPEHIEGGRYFFEPFNSLLQPELNERSRFALNNVPDAAKGFQSGDVYVAPCDALLQ
jgi:hypothetical protein